MKKGALVKHQIKIEITNGEGVIKLLFPNNQTVVWPVKDDSVSSGVFYLSLSPIAQLPTKEELARQVLEEIFQNGE